MLSSGALQERVLRKNITAQSVAVYLSRNDLFNMGKEGVGTNQVESEEASTVRVLQRQPNSGPHRVFATNGSIRNK